MSVSIHAPHEGERRLGIIRALCRDAFQSTLPTRGSDSICWSLLVPLDSFNPRSPRGGATSFSLSEADIKSVSIHAPHEGERPNVTDWDIIRWGRFNPRSPRGGATFQGLCLFAGIRCSFNPRSPRGGATQGYIKGLIRADMFQSTLPTRGSDVDVSDLLSMTREVSIHAPHEGERRRLLLTSAART